MQSKTDKLYTEKLIIVEGKYDKIRLENIVDAEVIAVNGFGLYHDDRLKKTIRTLGKNGVIILTDSDTAGYKIRVYLNSLLEGCDVTNVFLPQIAGKEKRKHTPSAEGFLGVEGVSDDIIRDCIKNFCENCVRRTDITAADLVEHGYSGCPGAAAKKSRLLAYLGVQKNISNKFLLRILNSRFSKAEFAGLKLPDD